MSPAPNVQGNGTPVYFLAYFQPTNRTLAGRNESVLPLEHIGPSTDLVIRDGVNLHVGDVVHAEANIDERGLPYLAPADDRMRPVRW